MARRTFYVVRINSRAHSTCLLTHTQQHLWPSAVTEPAGLSSIATLGHLVPFCSDGMLGILLHAEPHALRQNACPSGAQGLRRCHTRTSWWKLRWVLPQVCVGVCHRLGETTVYRVCPCSRRGNRWVKGGVTGLRAVQPQPCLQAASVAAPGPCLSLWGSVSAGLGSWNRRG